MAFSRFWNWLRSCWHSTTMPVGLWMSRTAEEVFNSDFKVFSRGHARFGVGQGSFMTESSRKAAEALVGPYLKEAAAANDIPMVFYMFTDVKSAEEYYSGEAAVKDSSFGTVTIEIRCDTIVGKSDADYIPKDGVILAETEYQIEEGDTVYDILTEAARQHRIQMETAGRWNMVYIAGINYLYELDFGDLSGWIYHVNGFSPAVGCGAYVLSDGDRIEWLYSCDIGNDLLD